MKQMNDVYDYIDFHNQTHATIEKLLRIDVRDYPEIAVREALLNLRFTGIMRLVQVH